MSKPKRNGLTPRQQKFCREYLKSLNASEAVRACGYKGENAHVVGPRMLSNVRIQAEVKKRLAEAMGSEFGGLKKRILDELTAEAFSDSVIEITTENGAKFMRHNPSKFKALELLAKYAGILTERVEITGKDGGAIEIRWPDDSNSAT